MNSTCIFLLALALFGAFAQAYVGTIGYGGGCCNTLCKGGYGLGYGAGFGNVYGGGAVCDTCQCVKTVVRPPCVERIPYCSRRVQSGCGTGVGVYGGPAVGIYSGAAGGAGYINGGFDGYGVGGYGIGGMI